MTPTNLLYNVVATPGALFRYWRQGQTGGRLTRALVAGTVPGVVAGSVIRVEALPGPQVFDGVIAVVLVPLGASLLLRRTGRRTTSARRGQLPPRLLIGLAGVVGCVGGIYGSVAGRSWRRS